MDSVLPPEFETDPSRYRHWRLNIEPPLAWLTMAVAEDAPLDPGYKLKLNSYDLGVDIELADVVQRLRFEHPEVRAVILTGGLDRVFSAGANIQMLAGAAHAFKVNFCKFTNETRMSIEDASANSGQHYLAALNGTAAGGGYELALACERIILVEDGASAVSLPEIPLLGVLPGTGGLTRLVDKRKVRRDRADVFATLAEGVKGNRAVEWGLVDEVVPRGPFLEVVRKRALELAGDGRGGRAPGIRLEPLAGSASDAGVDYRFVRLDCNRVERVAHLTVFGPKPGEQFAAWALRAFRELDDVLLRLRFHYGDIGLVLLKTRGDLEAALAGDLDLPDDNRPWLANEIRLLMARVLRRLELTSKSFFAVVDRGSCFAGSLLELALAADRIYMLDIEGVRIATSPLNAGPLAASNGVSRLAARFMASPARVEAALSRRQAYDARAALNAGLVTAIYDEIDWDDALRLAAEERTSFSPDALTGMEANLRGAGPENTDTKVFGRLSAWQNWIFSRPNATGERGALALYGKPERPRFDWRRT